MFEWSADAVRFRIDAEERNRFDEAIAKRLTPFLRPGDTVIDAGCGIGRMGLALAPCVKRVISVDRDPLPIASLRTEAARRGIQNLTAINADVFSQNFNEPCDAMAFCFCGGLTETLRAAKRLSSRTLLLVKRNGQSRRFTLRNVKLTGHSFEGACAALNKMNVPYRAQTFTLETGQPFRNLKDAARFFAIYDPSNELDEGALLKKLTPTGEEDFPYYLPAPRPMGLIAVSVSEIPDQIESLEE